MVAYGKPQQRKKKEAKGCEEREIKSSLFILDLKEGKLQESGKQEENGNRISAYFACQNRTSVSSKSDQERLTTGRTSNHKSLYQSGIHMWPW